MMKRCVVCEAEFEARTTTKTCSDTCRASARAAIRRSGHVRYKLRYPDKVRAQKKRRNLRLSAAAAVVRSLITYGVSMDPPASPTDSGGCVVCGAAICRPRHSKTCSLECSGKWRKQLKKQRKMRRRDNINAKNRQRYANNREKIRATQVARDRDCNVKRVAAYKLINDIKTNGIGALL